MNWLDRWLDEPVELLTFSFVLAGIALYRIFLLPVISFKGIAILMGLLLFGLVLGWCVGRLLGAIGLQVSANKSSRFSTITLILCGMFASSSYPFVTGEVLASAFLMLYWMPPR